MGSQEISGWDTTERPRAALLARSVLGFCVTFVSSPLLEVNLATAELQEQSQSRKTGESSKHHQGLFYSILTSQLPQLSLSVIKHTFICKDAFIC